MDPETYRIDHSLFEGVEFVCPERARESAVRLAVFLIRETGEREASVAMEVFRGEYGLSQWFHHDTVKARLEITDSHS